MDKESCDRREFLRDSALASVGVALVGCAGMARPAAGSTSSLTGALAGSATTPARPAPFGSPPEREGDYVEVNGARIFYQIEGEGTALLLIHGYPLSGALFGRNRDALADEFTVVTIDQRGYGKSEAPGIPDEISTYAEDALAVMDELGIERAVIGGHSMGGPVAFEMYQRAPERFMGMLLIDTIAAPASTIEAHLWRGFAEETRQMGPGKTTIAFLMKNMLTGDTRATQPELVDHLSAVMKAASKDAWIGGAQALATRPDYTGMLSSISVPTLVYTGLEDTVYPLAVAKGLAKKIPGAELAVIEDAAHAAVFEAPERTSEAIMDWAEDATM